MFSCVQVCISECGCSWRQGGVGLLELELQTVVNHLMRVLGTQAGSSAGHSALCTTEPSPVRLEL